MQKDSGIRRWAPLLLLLVAIVAAYLFGVQNYLSLTMIARHLAELKQFVSDNRLAALLIYIAVYIVVVALSLPGAALLSLGGAVVLGWQLSVPASILAATVGAVIVFQIVKTSLGSSIAERAGPFVQKLTHGFQRDAFNYLLFLRLTPFVLFFAVNAVAGLVRVDLRTFTLATFIGIIPGSLAFAWLGSGLDDVLQKSVADFEACMAAQPEGCVLKISALSLFSPQFIAGLSVLGIIALIPVGLRLWKQRA